MKGKCSRETTRAWERGLRPEAGEGRVCRKVLSCWHWWLTPVILVTQEEVIRRITVRSQPGQTVQETLTRKTHHKKGLVEWLKV
jgi:hypothetical protein